MPVVSVSDNFERAGPSLGSNWTYLEGSDITIFGSSDAGTSSGNGQEVYWNADSFDPNQWAEIVLTNVDGEQGPTVRCSTNATYNRYAAMAQGAGGYNSLEKVVSGTWTQLSSFSTDPVPGDTLRVAVEGTTVTAWLNGALIATSTDSSLATGAAGFGYWDSNGTARTESWAAWSSPWQVEEANDFDDLEFGVNSKSITFSATPPNDQLILLLYTSDNYPGDTRTWPTGFTEFFAVGNASISGAVFGAYKIASSESGATYTLSLSSTNDSQQVMRGVRISNADGDTVLDVVGSGITTGFSPDTLDIPGITTGANDAWVGAYHGGAGGVDADAGISGFTTAPFDSFRRAALYYQTKATAGATANPLVVVNAGFQECSGVAFSFVTDSGGTTIPISESGTLTFGGTIAAVRTLRRSASGTLTTSGVVQEQPRKALTASLSTAGSLVKQNIQAAFTGTLTTAGALVARRTKLLSLTATLTAAGALTRLTTRSLSGALTAAGNLLTQTRQTFTAVFTPSGTVGSALPGDLPFRDDFTSVIDANWDENDTQSVLAVSGERAVFAYTSAVDTWQDPSLVSPAINRSELGAFTALVRLTNQNDSGRGFKVGVSPSPTNPDSSGNGAVSMFYPDLRINGFNEPVSPYRLRAHDYLWTVIKRDGGGWLYLISTPAGANGHFPEWPDATVLGVTHAESDAVVYAHLAARRGRALVDYAALLPTADLPTGFDTRLGGALASEASGTRPLASNNIVDCGAAPRVIEAMLSRGANNDTRAVICFRGSDNAYANCWKFKGEFDRVSLHNTSGLVSQTGAVSMAASTPTHLMVIDMGTRIDCYVNGSRWITVNSSTGFGNTYAGTAGDTGASESITVTDFGAWGTVTLPDDFGPVPDAVTGQTSALFTDTFTLADSTNLSGQNGWTAQSGLTAWQANTNTARMTTNAVQGVLYRASGVVGGVNHEIEADITLPGTTASYPTDWFAGVFVRYTDANNFIQARYLYQDDSPEVEVWEHVGGAGTLIGYINLGGGALAAGSTHTLRLAVFEDEVAAYHDDELVVQATTTVLTGNNVGIGVIDTLPHGQPRWDNVVVKGTSAVLTFSPSGTVAPTGEMLTRTSRTITGTVTAAGALAKSTVKSFGGAFATAGALTKQTSKSFGGTLTASGSVSSEISSGNTTFPITVSGVLTLAGSLARHVAQTLTGAVTTTGTLIQQVRQRLTGALTGAGTLTPVKQKNVSRSGTLTPGGGSVTTHLIHGVSVTATLSPMGDLDLVIIRQPQIPPPEYDPLPDLAPPQGTLLSDASPTQGTLLSDDTPPEFIPRS